MYNGGDTAGQMVRFAYQGGEIILKLMGAGAKNLAAYLANVRKDLSLTHGRELTVQPLPINKMRASRVEAKRYGIQFCVLKDTGNGRTCDILVRAEDASWRSVRIQGIRTSRSGRRPDLGSLQDPNLAPNIYKSRRRGKGI